MLNLSLLFAERGDLLSSQLIETRDINNNQIYIDYELSILASDLFFSLSVEYGFWLYKITYETIDINNEPVEASGTIAYPRVDWPNTPNQAFPVLSYQHGTVVRKDAVTSQTGLWVLPALIAGYGYVFLEPDYLGLGISDGMHPYQIKEPYGTDVVDIIRAARQFSDESNQFQIHDQLFLAGYSEGGYATMAAHQIIERDYNDEIQITISFPMAGAYSMSGVMTDIMLDYTVYEEPFYFPYVLFSYSNYYSSTIGSAENYLLPYYASLLPDLFDGNHSGDDINNVMPEIPITIMDPDSITSFANNNNHPLRVALRENDLYDWAPQSTMYIIHALGDQLVPPENSQIAYDYFIENGASDVSLEMIPEQFGGHQDAAPFALLAAFTIAEENKIIYNVGDINQDQTLDILDIIGILDFILLNTVESYQIWAGDLNGDLNNDILDIIMLINIILEN